MARLASMVHQIDKDLIFLNEVRNVLRHLPNVEDEFTIVIAGYPNVGKSSFIRRVSSADPQVASYPFTTKGIIVGHRDTGRQRTQFVDTPGILDRPVEERNQIEKQALSAIMNVAHVILFIIDPSEHCGYPMAVQLRLLDEVKTLVKVPVLVVANKSDLVICRRLHHDVDRRRDRGRRGAGSTPHPQAGAGSKEERPISGLPSPE